MPIYEYRCSACGFQKEYLQKVSDAPPVTCPECGKESLAKMVTAAGFQLKGSGWYATDFKGSVKTAKAGETAGADSKSDAKADSASGPKSDAKPDAKTEAKPDAKSEAKPDSQGERFASSPIGDMKAVRKYLLAGILVWIPLGITIWVLKLLVDLLDQSLLLLPAQWRTEAWLGFHVPGSGRDPGVPDRASSRACSPPTFSAGNC